MKTFKTVLLITGILVAGMAYNTMAQSPVNEDVIVSSKEEKVYKHELKREVKSEVKAHKHAGKHDAKFEMKRSKHQVKAIKRRRES